MALGMRRVVLLCLLWASPAAAYWLDLTGTAQGRCALVTGREAKAVLRMAGVPGPLVRATVFLCNAPDRGVTGVAVSPSGRRACEITGTTDAQGCLTLSACGAVGPPRC